MTKIIYKKVYYRKSYDLIAYPRVGTGLLLINHRPGMETEKYNKKEKKINKEATPTSVSIHQPYLYEF